MILPRRQTERIVGVLSNFPAVAVLGPRQVGKTTLAREIASDRESIYLDLESTPDLSRLSEPELYLRLNENRLVVLDEIHRVPEIFRVLRGLIDDGKRRNLKNGRFLLLGSASIELLRQSGESLAGRIAFVDLGPFDAREIESGYKNLGGTSRLWSRGGFPDSFLASSDVASADWRDQFIRTYLERDIPLLGPRIPAETLRRLWTMLAHSQGGILNLSALARGLGIDGKTVSRYIDLLTDLLLVRRLTPWHSNTRKRLTKSPKIYIRDSGIVHTLLGIKSLNDVLSHPVSGQSWEGFVLENLLAAAPQNTLPTFYRSSGGAEIDIVLTLPGGMSWAIEVKRSIQPKTGRGFYSAVEEIQPERQLVVYPGSDSFPVSRSATAISLSQLMDELICL
ncbi:MAG: ATP-binding protein [Rhodothermia bacterium]|nr:MAG: ATP-binding protein [Rhodothermia bacterium]